MSTKAFERDFSGISQYVVRDININESGSNSEDFILLTNRKVTEN